MNGPEHFRAAQNELEFARSNHELDEQRFHLAAAQVHATLALTAAVAGLVPINPPLNRGSILGRTDDEWRAWDEVLSS